MHYLLISMLVVTISISIGCLAVSLIMGEFIITMCFMVTTVMLVIEIDKETRRKI
jgi:hypothetical protein